MTPENVALLREKVQALIIELKLHGLWKSEAPAWVHDFAQRREVSEVDFFEWFQFVYIPNKLHPETREALPRVLVMPQAKPFVTQSGKYASVIRLMVEIDGL